MKKLNKKFDKKILILAFPILIFLGKLLRWTILKSVLVDMSVGGSIIENIVYGNPSIELFNASNNTAVVFQTLNFFNMSTTIHYEIFISIIFNLILFVLLFLDGRKYYSQLEFIFLSLSIAVLNIWDFCLAKEPIQFLFFLMLYLVIISKKLTDKQKWIGSCFVVLLITLYYRIYYILILMFIIATYYLFTKILSKMKNKIKIKHVIYILLGYAFLYFIALNAIKILDYASFEELIRVRMRVASANTEIISIFNSENLILFSLEFALTTVRLLFPVELLTMGFKYYPYVLYQIFISYYMIKSIINFKNNDNYQNIALYAFIGFLLGSAAFEPDFGSWVRHEAAAFPLLLIISNIKYLKKKELTYEEKTTN